MSSKKAVPAGKRPGPLSVKPTGLLFFLAWFGLQPLLTATSDLTADEVARRLDNKLKSVDTLRAEFRQFYYSSAAPEPMTGRGQLFIRRPNRMRWEYSSPEKQIFLLKDGNFWLYFPEDKQLIKNAAQSEVLESEILGLLSGNLSLSERYRVEFNSFPSDRKTFTSFASSRSRRINSPISCWKLTGRAGSSPRLFSLNRQGGNWNTIQPDHDRPENTGGNF